VADYRLYFLDGKGRIVRVVPFSAQSDKAAIERAASERGGATIELWERGRLIKVFDSAKQS
jgi:hypothetical protein